MGNIMDDTRRLRYRQKSALLLERIEDLGLWIEPEDLSSLEANKQVRLAVLKAYQEAAECVADLSAMILVDMKLVSKDDHVNTDELMNRGIISKELADRIHEMLFADRIEEQEVVRHG